MPSDYLSNNSLPIFPYPRQSLSWEYYQPPLPLTEQKQNTRVREMPKQRRYHPHTGYINPLLLLLAIFGFINLTKTPRRILARGAPKFAVLTDYDEAEKAQWDEWKMIHEEKMETLLLAQDDLWFSAAQHMWFLAGSALLCFLALVDMWRTRREAAAIVQSMEDSGVERKGGYGMTDRKLKRWQRNWTRRCILVAAATVIGVVSFMHDISLLERKFWTALLNVVGEWPKMKVWWVPID